ncbi:hypothetical protein ALC53_07560 [Atta colombica]|uniref:Transposable element P transposase-like RNase H domain-containing protein n=1 Tax=Atta colombica TaxID=520822 RepID=A0A195BCU2_9HYME|nr:hypothetical protein ALC53_07560 [Atta colombica]
MIKIFDKFDLLLLSYTLKQECVRKANIPLNIIAYFFMKKMSSIMLSELLKTILILCSENKLRVHSLTFDGASNVKL